MESMMIHLEKRQKDALRKRASGKGSTMAAEIRQAINLYLRGVSGTDLELLDLLSRQAEQDLTAMEASLTRALCKVDRSLAELEQLRRKPSP